MKNSNEIPKIIHYCWFGNKEKPEYIINYINSWKKFLPDYDIIEWNEKNFDVNMVEFTKDAYKEKKFAFVSDVARLYALYKYGGIYFDTDVEVIKPFDKKILQANCVFGFETENRIATSFMACVKGNPLIKKFLNIYKEKEFNYSNEKQLVPNVVYLTSLLNKIGLLENGEYQKLENGVYVYPKEFFSPYDYINCINDKTEDTYCIHYFTVSWLSDKEKFKRRIKYILVKIIGRKNLIKLRNIKNKMNSEKDNV